MKKEALSVYLAREVMAQLIELAGQRNQSKSVIAEAAIASFVTPDDSDRRESTLVRRLDLLTRQGERLERDLSIAVHQVLAHRHPAAAGKRASRRAGEKPRALRIFPGDAGAAARERTQPPARSVNRQGEWVCQRVPGKVDRAIEVR
jgi:hypothetical protein